MAANISKDIRNAWNRPAARILLGSVYCKVVFVIRGFYTQTPLNWITGNRDYKKIFIRIEDKTDNRLGGSYIDGLGIGGNSGYFNLNNIKEVGSATESHEIGHVYGFMVR